MALEPVLSFWNKSTDTNIEVEGWNVGIVKATETSNILNLRLWNNKAGIEDASYMQDCTLFILDENQANTMPVVTGGWLEGKCTSLLQPSFIKLNGTVTLPIGAAGLDDNQISGEINDGLEGATTNFADVELKFEVPYQAPHGNHKFHIAVRYFYS
jgi:hypothetical protein